MELSVIHLSIYLSTCISKSMLYFWSKCLKNHTFWGSTYPYRPYKWVPPTIFPGIGGHLSKTSTCEVHLLNLVGNLLFENDIIILICFLYYCQAVQRSLEKLASKGIITEKINGKQKVYAPKQVNSIKNVFHRYD